jgi:hypothetical protein
LLISARIVDNDSLLVLFKDPVYKLKALEGQLLRPLLLHDQPCYIAREKYLESQVGFYNFAALKQSTSAPPDGWT